MGKSTDKSYCLVVGSWVGKDYCRAAPHVASRERCAAPPVARGDRRAALDAGSYQTLLERLVLQRFS
jgi:hypothetical protein